MSIDYQEYIVAHISNVQRGLAWISKNLNDIFVKYDGTHVFDTLHDESKFDDEEWDAYDAYFYKKRTPEVEKAFNYAWLHHIHNNPHHWQYWVLINDDEEEGTVAHDIPKSYILEMICDWWSFSWKSGDLHEIFKWYDEHKERMILSDATRKSVEEILEAIKKKLDEEKKEEQ